MNITQVSFFAVFLSGWFTFSFLHGQTGLDGRVIDRETGEPLAFVNIVYNEKGTGTTTSLDGYFTVTGPMHLVRPLII